jgi:hypothetical protein
VGSARLGAPPPPRPRERDSYPGAGELLFYPGGPSEVEILFPYGATCFASKMGQLAGTTSPRSWTAASTSGSLAAGFSGKGLSRSGSSLHRAGGGARPGSRLGRSYPPMRTSTRLPQRSQRCRGGSMRKKGRFRRGSRCPKRRQRAFTSRSLSRVLPTAREARRKTPRRPCSRDPRRRPPPRSAPRARRR